MFDPLRPHHRSTGPIARRWLAAGLLAACASTAMAQTYPAQPITLIVPFSAGAGTDQTARLLARSLEKHGGQPVVVVNRPGAGGAIGMAALAQATPDGYTLGILNTPNVLTIPIERTVPFALDTYDLIANLVDDPGTLSVRADSPWRDLSALVAQARSQPDTLTYGSAGIGSAGHIAMLLFQRATDTQLRHVPFKGTADVATALLGGQIDIATANLGEALGYARHANWRTLGQMRAERSPMAPDLPTLTELGHDVLGGSLRGLGAPQGLPQATRDSLAALVAKAIDDHDFRAAARQANQDVHYLPAGPYAQTLKTLQQQFEAVWRTTPWTP